jgi:hypothetical protein
MADEQDNSSDLAVLGFFAGGFIGYLLRPSYPYLNIGQLPFETVITRGARLDEFDSFLYGPIAEVSFNYIVVGAILGLFIGWIVGKLIR